LGAREFGEPGIPAVAEVTIEQIEVTVLVPGVTEAGLNEHVAEAGSPTLLSAGATVGQVKVTADVKFPSGVTLTIYEAVLPAVRVTVVGDPEITKLAAPTVRESTGTAAGGVAMLFASPR